MTDSRKAGFAFIFGNLALVLLMAVHPTGEQLVNAGSRFDAGGLLHTTVHTLVILVVPLLFLGAIGLTREIEDGKRLAISALVFYGFALCAGVSAGAVDGFVSPGLFGRMLHATDPATEQVWRAVLVGAGSLNQAV